MIRKDDFDRVVKREENGCIVKTNPYKRLTTLRTEALTLCVSFCLCVSLDFVFLFLCNDESWIKAASCCLSELLGAEVPLQIFKCSFESNFDN